jgi:hypothetical protein
VSAWVVDPVWFRGKDILCREFAENCPHPDWWRNAASTTRTYCERCGADLVEVATAVADLGAEVIRLHAVIDAKEAECRRLADEREDAHERLSEVVTPKELGVVWEDVNADGGDPVAITRGSPNLPALIEYLTRTWLAAQGPAEVREIEVIELPIGVPSPQADGDPR